MNRRQFLGYSALGGLVLPSTGYMDFAATRRQLYGIAPAMLPVSGQPLPMIGAGAALMLGREGFDTPLGKTKTKTTMRLNAPVWYPPRSVREEAAERSHDEPAHCRTTSCSKNPAVKSLH